VLRDADTAMYRAKSAGKARYAMFDATMHAQMVERLELEAALRQAVEQAALVLHYQPIVAVPSGQLLGVEALVRWQHPTRGELPPTAFIPLAEETGLIISLGAWVMRTACTQLAAWQAAGVPIPWVAINVSVRQVQRQDLPALIRETLAATGLAPEALHLEITESCLVDPIAETQATLAQVQALGVRIALDDFGMGYSSLRSMQHLPLDTLKIAQPFVQNIATCGKAAAVSTAIITLAKSLGMTVIAEGVEAEAQIAWLTAHHCDAIQGYAVGPPVGADAMGTAWATVRLPHAGTEGSAPAAPRGS
jgi:EAL domain-containing protein (putative c-di-GMP-specific phosphodiesterase class I)